jgi:GNAT superfamily N-acetyltransferase
MIAISARQEAEGMPFRESSKLGYLAAVELNNHDEVEVLSFLAERPIHTVFMASLIRDNGVVSPRNRGSFYGYRGHDGALEGVALIGHATLVEARNEASLAALAHAAHDCSSAWLMRGEPNEIVRFWNEYKPKGKAPRLICSELLLEQRTPASSRGPLPNLHQASVENLEQVVAINAELFIQEAGRNPLETNPDGFRGRIARRIEQGRVWIWTRDGEIIFKADIVADTPQAIYLESLYVIPAERGKGYGLSCLSQLGSILLTRTEAICLTVNRQSQDVVAFYRKAGYRLHSNYETIYLQ